MLYVAHRYVVNTVPSFKSECYRINANTVLKQNVVRISVRHHTDVFVIPVS